MESLESEIKFLELFGLTLEGPDNSNRYKVFDENKKEVGFIQKKKLYNKNEKKGLDATYGYITKIETDSIIYENTRKIIDEENGFYYEFEVKREDGEKDSVNLSLRENAFLNIWSNEYGFIDFKLNYNSFYLNFKSKTDNFNVEEIVTADIEYPESENVHRGKEYTYTLSYCNKDQDIDKKIGRTTKSLFVKNNVNYPWKGNVIVKELYWQDNELKETIENEFNVPVTEVIKKHQMGIDAFKHFRYLVSKLIPTQQELIGVMLKKRGVKEYPFALFIEEYKPNIDLHIYDAVYDITEELKLCIKNQTIAKINGSLEDQFNNHCGFLIHNNEQKEDFVDESIPVRCYLHKGYYEWDEKYIYRYNNEEIVILYDIANKKVINDKNEINNLLNDNKKKMK